MPNERWIDRKKKLSLLVEQCTVKEAREVIELAQEIADKKESQQRRRVEDKDKRKLHALLSRCGTKEVLKFLSAAEKVYSIRGIKLAGVYRANPAYEDYADLLLTSRGWVISTRTFLSQPLSVEKAIERLLPPALQHGLDGFIRLSEQNFRSNLDDTKKLFSPVWFDEMNLKKTLL